MFREIYHEKNIIYTSQNILYRLIEEVAELVKPVITMDIDELKWSLPDIFAWICALANKLEINLNEIMIRKYVSSNPPGKSGQTKIDPYAIIGKHLPESLEDWQKYMSHLYSEENRENSPFFMLSRLVEDLGKASRILRKREDMKNFEDSIAAVLAWTIGLANKFGIDFPKEIWEKYPNMCHRCKSRPCRCSRMSVIFISYCNDTKDYMESAKKLIENTLGLSVRVFTELGPSFHRGRMVEVFNAINESDAGVIIMDRKFSRNVYAEFIEMSRALDENNIFIFVKDRDSSEREQSLAEWIEELKIIRRIDWFKNEKDFLNKLEKAIKDRIRQIQEEHYF